LTPFRNPCNRLAKAEATEVTERYVSKMLFHGAGVI
jgi:hypothetical protein